MIELGKVLKLRKAKYLKRTGGPGHYKYWYRLSSEREKIRKETTKDVSKEKESLQEIEEKLKDYFRGNFEAYTKGKDLRKVYKEHKSSIEELNKLLTEADTGQKKTKEKEKKRQRELDEYVKETKGKKISVKSIPYMTDSELKNTCSIENVR